LDASGSCAALRANRDASLTRRLHESHIDVDPLYTRSALRGTVARLPHRDAHWRTFACAAARIVINIRTSFHTPRAKHDPMTHAATSMQALRTTQVGGARMRLAGIAIGSLGRRLAGDSR